MIALYIQRDTIQKMEFEWNEKKNINNHLKHGVWFEEAQTTWADESSLEFYDPEHSDYEERFIRLGYSSNSNLLLVVFCERNEHDTIRIISARKATPKEKGQYAKRI